MISRKGLGAAVTDQLYTHLSLTALVQTEGVVADGKERKNEGERGINKETIQNIQRENGEQVDGHNDLEVVLVLAVLSSVSC